MAQPELFEFSDYREYLRKAFPGSGENRGRRIHLAKVIRCQPSFVSQVLTDRAHLSLEHAIQTSEFLGHTEGESHYFLLLVQIAKAGSPLLEKYFRKQLESLKKKRQEVRNRIKVSGEISSDDQMKYYSAWYYSALHILSALPPWNTPDAMAKKLRLDAKLVRSALQFLDEKGFVKSAGGGTYSIGSARIHLPKGSPMLGRHHTNWRMRAIDAVDNDKSGDLHYSAVLGISRSDVGVFRERLLKLLEDLEPIVRDSNEEVPVVLLMDLFEL